MRSVFALCLFLATAPGCLTATVVGSKGTFQGPALPASIEEWERSHKQTMINDHLNQALEAYRTAPDEEKSQRWEEVKQIQGLYEASDIIIHPLSAHEPVICPEPARVYPGLPWRSSIMPIRSVIDVYEKDTGRVITQVGIRGTEVPSEFRNYKHYGFRVRTL